MNQNEILISNLKDLAAALEQGAGETEEILDLSYDVLDRVQDLINDTVGYN